jgi:hypothetical protein
MSDKLFKERQKWLASKAAAEQRLEGQGAKKVELGGLVVENVHEGAENRLSFRVTHLNGKKWSPPK